MSKFEPSVSITSRDKSSTTNNLSLTEVLSCDLVKYSFSLAASSIIFFFTAFPFRFGYSSTQMFVFSKRFFLKLSANFSQCIEQKGPATKLCVRSSKTRCWLLSPSRPGYALLLTSFLLVRRIFARHLRNPSHGRCASVHEISQELEVRPLVRQVLDMCQVHASGTAH